MIPGDTCQVQLVGTSPGGEEFATSFWIEGTPVQSAAGANAFATAIRDLPSFAALLTILRQMISADQAYTQIRVYSHSSNGTTATFTGFANIPTGVGTGGANTPLQIAMVATLRTDFAGRRYRGRMYFPASGIPQGTNHQYVSSSCTNLCNALATFFAAVRGLTNEGSVVIVSRVATTATPVASLSVDSKPDVQRRRAASLSPAFTANAVVPGI